MAQVQVFTGPARSKREKELNTLWLSHQESTLLIVPTRRYAQQRLQNILRQGNLSGIWGRPVLTFSELVKGILSETGGDNRSVSPLSNALYIESAIQAAMAENHHPELMDALKTPGMQRHLQNIISQLKQAAVDPEVFMECIQKPSPTDNLIAAVYTRYQAALQKSGEYDQQGLFWVARELADKHKPLFLSHISTLILDGFDDFTPSELNLLTALEPHLDSLVFGLPYDESPLRLDAYKRVHTTASTLRRLFNSGETLSSETSLPVSQCQYINQHLFWRDTPPEPIIELQNDLTLIQCHNPTHEVETAGRAIKTLLLDGTAPTSIAITARSLTPYAPVLCDTFEEFGLPLTIEQRGLVESRTAQDILLLYTAMENWEHSEILSLLERPWFHTPSGNNPSLRDTFRTIALEARIIRGQHTWSTRLEQLKNRVDSDSHLAKRCARLPQFSEALESLRQHISLLIILNIQLPAKATPSEHLAGLRIFLKDAGFLDYFQDSDNTVMSQKEAKAWLNIQSAFSELENQFTTQSTDPISQADFAAVLRQAFQLVPWEYDIPADGIQALDLETIRHLSFDHVFFLGVNEGLMPTHPKSNALYSEQDKEHLQRMGIPFEARHIHLEREYLLFLRIFNNARHHLTISWHALSSANQEIRPSLFIDYVRELIPADQLEEFSPDTHLETLVPQLGSVASWRDAANRTFAFHSESSLPETIPFHHICTLIQIEKNRYSYEPFGPYDGTLTNSQVQTDLQFHYNSEHLFSVAQLEKYIDCPFAFFLAQVLHIQPQETPEEEVTPILRGQILHDVLETFHKHFLNLAATEIPAHEAQVIFQTHLNKVIRREAARNPHIPRGVWHAENNRLLRTLKRYLVIEHEKSGDTWHPSHFEVSFGTNTHATADPISTPQPFILQLEKEEISFQGRIDRIDQSNINSIRLVDYKTGQPPSQTNITKGKSLQLTLYAMAAESLLIPNSPCDEAWFIQVGSAKNRTEIMCRMPKRKNQVPWESRIDAAKEAVQNALAGIRSGVFHPTTHTESCKGCPNENVCRYEKGRVNRKPVL